MAPHLVDALRLTAAAIARAATTLVSRYFRRRRGQASLFGNVLEPS